MKLLPTSQTWAPAIFDLGLSLGAGRESSGGDLKLVFELTILSTRPRSRFVVFTSIHFSEIGSLEDGREGKMKKRRRKMGGEWTTLSAVNFRTFLFLAPIPPTSHSAMSANSSAASTEPPLKRIKVEHTSGGPSIRESAEVMIDGTDARDGRDDGAILAA